MLNFCSISGYSLSLKPTNWRLNSIAENTEHIVFTAACEKNCVAFKNRVIKMIPKEKNTYLPFGLHEFMSVWMCVCYQHSLKSLRMDLDGNRYVHSVQHKDEVINFCCWCGSRFVIWLNFQTWTSLKNYWMDCVYRVTAKTKCKCWEGSRSVSNMKLLVLVFGENWGLTWI